MSFRTVSMVFVVTVILTLGVSQPALAQNWNKSKENTESWLKANTDSWLTEKITSINYEKESFPVDPKLDEAFRNALNAPFVNETFQKVEIQSRYRNETISVFQKLQDRKSPNVIVGHESGGFLPGTHLAANFFYNQGFNVFVFESIESRGILASGKASIDGERVTNIQATADAAATVLYVRKLAETNETIDVSEMHWFGSSGFGSEGAQALSRPAVRTFYSPENPELLRLTSATSVYMTCANPRGGGAIDTPLLMFAAQFDQENLPYFCAKNFGEKYPERVDLRILPAAHGYLTGQGELDGSYGFNEKSFTGYCEIKRSIGGNLVFPDGRLLNPRRIPEFLELARSRGCMNKGYWFIKDSHLTRYTLEQSLAHMRSAPTNLPSGSFDLLPERSTNFYRTTNWVPLTGYPDAKCTNGDTAGFFETVHQEKRKDKIALVFGGTDYTFPKNQSEFLRLYKNHSTTTWVNNSSKGWTLFGATADLVDVGYQVYVIPNCSLDSWVSDSEITLSGKEYPLRGRSTVRAVLKHLQKEKVVHNKTELLIFGIANGILAYSANTDLFDEVPHQTLRVVADGVVMPSPIDSDFVKAVSHPSVKTWNKDLFSNNPNCSQSFVNCLPTAKKLTEYVDSRNLFFTFQQGYDTLNIGKRRLDVVGSYKNQFGQASGLLAKTRWLPSPWVTLLGGWDYAYENPAHESLQDSFRTWLDGGQSLIVAN